MLLPLLMNSPRMLGQVEQASNWQADYWKRGSKDERDEQTLRERIELGILPADLGEDAADAIRMVSAARTAFDQGRIDAGEQVRIALEAREAYEAVYREAYREAYVAEVVADLWRKNLERITRRRKAAALLLH